MTGGRRFLDVAVAGLMAAVGGVAMTSSFRIEDLLRPVGAAAVVAVAISLVMTGLLSARLAFAVVAAVAVLVPAAAVACGGSLADVQTGLVDGRTRILETAGLAPPDAVLLVVPFALTAIAAFLGAELVQRTRSSVGPVIPSLVVLGLGLAFGFAGRLPPTWLPVAWVALAAAGIGLRSRRPRPAAPDTPAPVGPNTLAAPRRSLVGAVITVLLVALPAAGVAHALAPRLPGLDDQDRYSMRDPDRQGDDEPGRNPIDLMVELRTGADTVQFSADTSARVERWRVAALDTYDNTTWTHAGSFRPAGEELQPPVSEQGQVEGASYSDRVSQTVERGEWEGPWLPVADRPVEVDVDGVQFDPATGVLRAGGDLPPKTYSVDSVVPLPDGAALADAGPAQDDEATAALQLPGELPEELVAAAEEATSGTGSAYAEAVAIERYLTSPDTAAPFELAEDSPGGIYAYSVGCFVAAEASEDHPECAGRRGRTEQFVTAFALMARHVGLPTRVVVGFAGADTAGRHDVTAHAATAWVEVKFEGVGWVTFDPVPDVDVVTETPAAVPTGGESDDTPPTTAPPESEATATADADDESAEDDADRSSSGLLLWVGGALALVVVVTALPGLARKRRHQRRRAATAPAERIVGAWNNAVDQLVAVGLSVTRDRAVTDVVVAGQDVVQPAAAEPLVPLGRLTNLARFAPGTPDTGAADEAWALSDRFTTECRKTQTPAQRLRHYFHLR